MHWHWGGALSSQCLLVRTSLEIAIWNCSVFTISALGVCFWNSCWSTMGNAADVTVSSSQSSSAFSWQCITSSLLSLLKSSLQFPCLLESDLQRKKETPPCYQYFQISILFYLDVRKRGYPCENEYICLYQ